MFLEAELNLHLCVRRSGVLGCRNENFACEFQNRTTHEHRTAALKQARPGGQCPGGRVAYNPT